MEPNNVPLNRPGKQTVAAWSVAVLALLAASVAYNWPLPKLLGTHVPGDQRDPLLNAELLHHVFGSIARLQWGQVWDAPFFFPHHNTVAFSESFLGTAWYGVPLWLVAPDPVVLHNLFHITGMWLSAVAAMVLGRVVTGSLPAGLLVGVAYGLGPFHLVHSMHVQMHQAWGAPLAFLGVWWACFGTQRRGAGWVLAGVATSLQVLSASYLGMFTLVGCVLPGAAALVHRRKEWREHAPWVLAGAGISLLLLGIPMVHYLTVSKELGFHRSLQEMRGFSTNPQALFAFPDGLLWPPTSGMRAPEPEKSLWLGRLAPLLAITALLLGLVKTLRRKGEAHVFPVLVMAAVTFGISLWMAAGPGPTDSFDVRFPFSFLVHGVPGFDGLRVPARFHNTMLLMVALAAGMGVHALLGNLGKAAGPLTLLLAVVVGLDAWPRGYPVVPLPDGGDMGVVLKDVKANAAPGPILELPYRLYWRAPQNVLNTSRHGHPTTNGYSGIEPPLALALRYLLPAFPAARTDELVRQMGVHAMALHRGPPRADQGETYPGLENALTLHALPAGFELGGAWREGAWLKVDAASPGPLQDLTTLWTSAGRACGAAGVGPRTVRVDLPLSHVAVLPTVRHSVVLKGGEPSRAVAAVTAVGMMDSLVAAVAVDELEMGATLQANGGAEIPVLPGDIPPGPTRVESNVPAVMRVGEPMWLRAWVHVAIGVLAAPIPERRVKGHELRVEVLEVPNALRLGTVPFRTDASPGCPGVAEGPLEITRGKGAVNVRLSLVPVGGGPAVASVVVPVVLE